MKTISLTVTKVSADDEQPANEILTDLLSELAAADPTDPIPSSPGTPGQSAYEIAQAAGYSGTQTQWLASLKGANGKSAYELAVQDGYTGTLTQWLASLKIKGDKGDTGSPGKSAYEVAVLNGYQGTVQQWLASLVGSGNGGSSAKENPTIVYPVEYGAVGDGVTDDSAALQAMFTACIANNYKFFVGKSHAVYTTINWVPPAGKSEFRLDGEFTGTAGLSYKGAANTSCVKIIGMRFCNIQGMDIGLGSNANCIAVDIDTAGGTPSSDSTSNISFRNCNLGLGSAINNRGWRLGHVSGGGGDISVITWDNCAVYGNYGQVISGQIGWHIEGSNTLQNVWNNCFGAYLDRLFSNKSGAGAAQTGNGACYFFGVGTSHNNIEFEITNAQSYLISGGRFELGNCMLSVENSNVSPAISFNSCEVSNYAGHPLVQGCLFNVDMPCSLNIENCNIGGSYGINMIKLGGGGGNRCVGRLKVSMGCIAAPKNQFITRKDVNNTTKWWYKVEGVGVKVGVEVTDLHTDVNGALLA